MESEIRLLIENKYDALTRNHKKIADFVLNNFISIPFKSVNEISEATEVSVASIVRFAQSIGYSGFLEMREKIGNSLQQKINNKNIFSLLDEKNINSDTIISVANQEISNINDTFKLIDRGNFEQSIRLILDSDRVFTAGLGISYMLAEILAYQLNQVAIDSTNLKHSHSSFLEQALFFNKNDLTILFSFPPYSKETIDLAEYLKSNNFKTVSVTNKAGAPVTRFSTTYLIVKSENMLFTNSFSAISVLINAIATKCALLNKSKAKEILKKLNNVAELQNLTLNNEKNS